MEAGEYETNTLLLNNISTINFRVYEAPSDLSKNLPSAALEFEGSLRENGHLAFFDPDRRGVWCFRIQEKEVETEDSKPTWNLDTTFKVSGQAFILAEEGTIEPLSIQKGRSQAPSPPASTISASSTASPSGTVNIDPVPRSPFGAPGGNPWPIPTKQETSSVLSADTQTKGGPSALALVYENFIAAVLHSLSTAICTATRSLPLNYRTVLFTPNLTNSKDFPPETTIGTLAAYLTTIGTLVVSLKLSQCKGLSSLENIFAASLTRPGEQIFAAPFGIRASNPSITIDDFGAPSLAQTPNTQALSFRRPFEGDDGLWKQACLRILQLRGIPYSLLKGCSWVNITVSRQRLQDPKNDTPRNRDVTATTTIPWPGPLCFRRKTADATTGTRLRDTILSGHEESRDPLGIAGRWMDSASEREEQIAKRKADRVASAASESNGIRPRPLVMEDMTPVVGRSNIASAGAMYPTPPDAIQQHNGITPTLDAATASPRNLSSATATVDIVDMAHVESEPEPEPQPVPEPEPEPEVHHPDNDMWDRPEEPRRERSGSNNSLGDPSSILMDSDMFGDNDITEADFNFFDEDPGDLDIDMADLDDPSPVQVLDASPPKETSVKKEETHTKLNEVPDPVSSPQKSEGFTIPELRHARSFLGDPQATRIITEEKKATSKRTHSPFNPETVFKRVRASVTQAAVSSKETNQNPKRKASVFEKIDFGPALPIINKKYEKGGLYDFEPTIAELQKKTSSRAGALPETDYLKRHGKRTKKLKEPPYTANALMRGLTSLDVSASHISPVRVARSPSDDDASSVESDQDDSSYTSEELPSPTKASFKGTVVDEDVASQVTFFRDSDTATEPDQRLALGLPKLSRPHGPEIPLSRLLMDPEPLALELPLTDEDTIQIAQLLTEQAALGDLSMMNLAVHNTGIAGPGTQRRQMSAYSRMVANILQGAFSSSIKGFSPSRLKDLLEIPDVPAQGQLRGIQPRPVPGRDPNAEQLRLSNVYQIPSHHLEMRRSETRLSVLPSAVTFWESLGMAPASGSKDVYALCVFPGWSGMSDNTRTFLGRMKSLYELLKLGTFENVPLPNEFESGLLPYEVDRISTSPDASVTRQGSALIESMDVLQATLSDLPQEETNIVIFMVYTPNNPGTIVEACLAFQRFSETCKPLLAGKGDGGRKELILQLVSADLISSPTALVITPSSALVKLCVEMYDRCGSPESPMSTPAILLEQPPPRLIDFKLTGTPSASLIHENSCLHVAYAQSSDERWVSAAWTDDRGSRQGTASYCLGRKGRPLSTQMTDVAHAIWEMTLEFIAHRKVHWRIIITKCGPMDTAEIDFWSGLARTESTANVALILMTVDTSPSLQLVPPATQISSSTTGFYTTPVSTPQTNIVSPEQSATPITNAATAPTPGADGGNEPEGDAVLLDLTDQIWGAVLGHRLNNSSTLLELHPALVSGYLIKKVGSKIEDPPVVIEVNLVHTEGTARPYEPLFREMLSNFRGLGTLARARGVVDMEMDVRPWHVAAAEKAVQVLFALM
ncbi:unnamed protein product [Clonostachys rosea f. rosea IK726]|uniref:Mediator of RNA polymerase II transcription subunit 13 n=2 Tax=Bionectria ochroleuca TaxID=29856 RepID=A0A0B7JZP6_BIOOC|nr:unnamed protein product [Clonostachys rosea f. rosea IK726]